MTDAASFIKHDQAKPKYHLVPPDALADVAAVLTYGADKYEPNNWVKGTEWSRYWDAAQRHLWAWMQREGNDPETGKSHLAHAACCVLFLLAYEQRKIGEDDRPPRA